jgi:four helix bundle protein
MNAMPDQNGAVLSYRDLVVWQKALDLAEAVYVATQSFPRQEVYGLTSQMRRAAVSVASNIAEGHARQTRGEYIQSVGMARGSLAELQTQTILAARLQILSVEIEHNLNAQLAVVGRLLNALRKSLLRRSPNP